MIFDPMSTSSVPSTTKNSSDAWSCRCGTAPSAPRASWMRWALSAPLLAAGVSQQVVADLGQLLGIARADDNRVVRGGRRSRHERVLVDGLSG